MNIDVVVDIAHGIGPHCQSHDAPLLEYATSVNIACGFHGGDSLRMRTAVQYANEHDLAIGAHVGYPDVRGGGETELSLPAEAAIADVLYQAGALYAICAAEQAPLRYIAPQGALGRRISADPAFALILAVQVNKFLQGIPLMLHAASPGANALRNSGIPVLRVAYADRAYLSTNQLAPSTRPGAHLTNEQLAEQAVQLATAGPIATLDNGPVQLHTDSITLMEQTAERFALLTGALAARGVHARAPR